MAEKHSPSGSRLNKLAATSLAVLIGASALAGCGSGEKVSAQSDHPENKPDTTTSAPANPTQAEPAGIIPEYICRTDPKTGEQATEENAVKMDQSAIKASSVYSEGKCAADIEAEKSIDKGFEVDYSLFEDWESKTEAQKDLAREYTYQKSGKVTLFNEQYEDSFMVIGEKGGGDGSWQFTPQQWGQYWTERAAVVNAIRNEKSNPLNEEVAHKMAEGLFVEGTSQSSFALTDLWNDRELGQAGTFLMFKEASLNVVGAAKPRTEQNGTVIYPLKIEVESTLDSSVAKNGKLRMIIAFSPITHVDAAERRTTETIRIYDTWTEGVHTMPDITFIDK